MPCDCMGAPVELHLIEVERKPNGYWFGYVLDEAGRTVFATAQSRTEVDAVADAMCYVERRAQMRGLSVAA